MTNSVEGLKGLQAEFAITKLIEHEGTSFVETANNVSTSLEDLTSEWNALQSNTQKMTNVVKSEDLNNIKPQFEEASIAWENTQNVSEVYQQMYENTGDPVEIDLDEIDTEEKFEEALKETHGVDELIDLSELTDEELEELLRELLEEELEEAA